MDNKKKTSNRANFMPETVGVIVGIGALVLWYFSSLAIDKTVVPTSFQSIVTITGSAFGAFFGAWCAFKLRQHEENQNKRNKRKTALDLCLFIMARQHNAISSMKLDYDKFPKTFERAFLMPAMKPPEYKDLKINLDDLMFLTDHEQISTLFHLSIEQERFEQVTFAVNLRNNYCLEHLQPALAKNQLNGKTMSSQELKEALGVQIFESSVNLANTANELLSANQESILTLHNKLHGIARSIFPDERFPKIGDPVSETMRV